MSKLNKGLGRGLDALLGSSSASDDILRDLNVTQLRPGKYQPRSHMDEALLNELAASIKAQGVMQPILVRELPEGNFEIIAGERRWRAAQIAGLSRVPVLVRKVPDNVALAMALIENIQRENLNPLEEATGIQRLIDEFKMTHQAAADAVGRSRSAASNLLRLLKLPQAIQNLLLDNKLDMGHARAILGLENAAQQIAAANRIAAAGLSVREAEQLVQKLSHPDKKPSKKKNTDRDIISLQERIAERLGTRVGIVHGTKGAGKLVIEYRTLDHLDDVLSKLGISKEK
jgi:ParB family transcriptional regulator, chromosome partitioning protein